MSMIQKQNFGVEIEMTGITRAKAAQVIGDYFGTRAFSIGTYYDTYGAKDRNGRTWKAMFDGSIKTYRRFDGQLTSGTGDYACEVVTPILQYSDIEDLQNVIRKLRQAGAITNSSCGIQKGDIESMNQLIGIVAERKAMEVEGVSLPHSTKWYKPGGQIYLFDHPVRAAAYAAKLEDRPQSVNIKYQIAPADLVDMLREASTFQIIDDDASEPCVCPRCGNHTMKPRMDENALSRRAEIRICDACGVAEALEELPGVESTELSDWAVFKRDWEDEE